VVVQGFGNVGSISARLLHEMGCRVVGLSDIQGGVYNANGIDVHRALRFSKEHGNLKGMPETEPVTNAVTTGNSPCDVLVPAALENQLTGKECSRVRASLVI